MSKFFLLTVALFLVRGIGVAVAGTPMAGPPYDPLLEPTLKLDDPIELVANDTARHIQIPVRIFLPHASPGPVILFSHGLGGSRFGYSYLGEHWAARGYVVVYIQHAGSDDSVWKGKELDEILPALKKAANPDSFISRVHDVSAVLDNLEEWNKAPDSPCQGRLDLKHIGMAGHSFGALTTQGVSGQRMFGSPRYTDNRITSAIAMSPSGDTDPRKADDAFGKISIPWMLMTGTDDVAPIGNQTPASRRTVFPALPPGRKYELVLDQAEHSAFSDRPLPGDRQPRNPNHHRVILALSTAFWDAYLKQNKAARAWLESPAVRQVLQPKDLFQLK